MNKGMWIKVMSAALAVVLTLGLFASTSSASAATNALFAKGNKTHAHFSLAKSLRDNLTTAAEKATGLDHKALRAALDGKSLADVLHAKNVDIAAVEATAKNETRAAIDQLVADGKLEAKRADAFKMRIDRVTDTLITKVRHRHHKVVTPIATAQPTTVS